MDCSLRARGGPKPLGASGGGSSLVNRLLTDSRFPFSVVIGLTERCNLQCRHCFSVNRSDAELSTEAWKSILDDLASCGVLFLSFTGGEATMRSDLVDLVAHARRRRFLVKLKTNGTLMDRRLASALRGAGLRQVSMSLYHLEAEKHDEFVGKEGAWEKTVEAACSFASEGGDVMLANVAMSWNYADIPCWMDWCVQQGFSYLIDASVNCRNDGDRDAEAYRLSEDELTWLLREPRLFDPMGYRASLSGTERSRLCMAGTNGPYLNPRGGVQLCQRLAEEIGNLRDQPFSRIWVEAPGRRRFLDLGWKDTLTCASCELQAYCQRCPASALLEEGDVLDVSPSDCVRARVLRTLCDDTRP